MAEEEDMFGEGMADIGGGMDMDDANLSCLVPLQEVAMMIKPRAAIQNPTLSRTRRGYYGRR